MLIFFFFLANRTFIDRGKLKKVVSSADDGASQPVSYTPEREFYRWL